MRIQTRSGHFIDMIDEWKKPKEIRSIDEPFKPSCEQEELIIYEMRKFLNPETLEIYQKPVIV